MSASVTSRDEHVQKRAKKLKAKSKKAKQKDVSACVFQLVLTPQHCRLTMTMHQNRIRAGKMMTERVGDAVDVEMTNCELAVVIDFKNSL